MAETLVQQIKNNAGKQWSRNTVADGNWLNSNTVQKFNQNDETLARAIESVSAAMEHFTPEITPSAWSCEPNQTIQTIEQNADGSLNVTYQSIESSTTSDDSLWSLYYQNKYDNVLASYTEVGADINHKAGKLSKNLTIPVGIYDIKIEVLYEPTQSTINNKLDIAISSSTSIDDALYQTFILFDDTVVDDDVQSQWITGIIKLKTSTTLKFLIKGESAQGRYKLNNIYINSIGGAAGPEGPQGPAGPTGPTGPQGIGLSAKSTESDYGHYVEIWKQGASQYDTRFEVSNGQDGQDGKSLSAEYTEDSEHRQTQIKIGQIDSSEQLSFNLPWGVDGHSPEIVIDPTTKEWKIDDVSTGVKAEGEDGTNGTSLSAKSSTITGGHRVELWEKGASQYDDSFNVMDGEDGVSGTSLAAYSSKNNKTTTVVIYDPVNDPTHQSPINTFTVLDGQDGQGFIEEHYYNKLSAHSADNAQKAVYADYATYAYIDSNTASAMSNIVNEIHGKLDTSKYVAQSGMFVTSASNSFPNDGQYGIIKDTNGIHWGEIQGGGGGSYTFDTTGTGHTFSGNGDTQPIGVNTDEFYRKTETSGRSELTTEFNTKTDYYPNTNDNTLKAQRLFVCTDDNDIIAHASHTDGKGSIFFRLG